MLAAERYASGGYLGVPGWLEPVAVRAFVELTRVQRRLDVSGPSCEIGVHLGRTLILLHLLNAADELAVGFDLYELRSEVNGHRRKAATLGYLAAHGGDMGRVRLVTADSSRLDPADVESACGGKPRIFSIDGGRSAGAIQHDLALAHACLCEGGVVSVTDFFRESWPEVAEGVCRHVFETAGLVPVAIGGNKLFLCNSSSHARGYRDALRESFAAQASESRIFSEPVLLLRPMSWQLRIVQTRLWRGVRQTAVGAWLRRVGNPVGRLRQR